MWVCRLRRPLAKSVAQTSSMTRSREIAWPGVAKQDAQQLEFLAGHLDWLPADPHRMRPLVQDDVTDG